MPYIQFSVKKQKSEGSGRWKRDLWWIELLVHLFKNILLPVFASGVQNLYLLLKKIFLQDFEALTLRNCRSKDLNFFFSVLCTEVYMFKDNTGSALVCYLGLQGNLQSWLWYSTLPKGSERT